MISLTTDFGLSDPFVGIMKGVILSRCPDARIIDLTHDLPPHDVLAGCLALMAAAPHFPPGTTHLAVVDPGVGTERAAIVLRTPRANFVAPDNGLLSFLDEGDILETHCIDNRKLIPAPASSTFHGRDLFAPAAALLAAGIEPARFGSRLPQLQRIDLPSAQPTDDGLCGQILHFDHFGNAITNLERAQLPAGAAVLVGPHRLPVVGTFADAPEGSALALVGSTGRVEICINRGCARRALDLHRGDAVRLILAIGGS